MRSTGNPLVGIAVAIFVMALGWYMRSAGSSDTATYMGMAFLVLGLIALVMNVVLWRSTRR